MAAPTATLPLGTHADLIKAWVADLERTDTLLQHAVHERHRRAYDGGVIERMDEARYSFAAPNVGDKVLVRRVDRNRAPETVEVTIGRELGSGSWGVVYRAQCVSQGVQRDCVIKYPKGCRGVRDLLWEAHWLLGRDDPHVIPCWGLGVVGTQVCEVDAAGKATPIAAGAAGGPSGARTVVPLLVQDYARGGNIYQMMIRSPTGKLEPKAACRIIHDISLGLFSMEVLHRDLKPENVMLDKDGSVVVIDFGLALPVDPAHRRQDGIVISGIAGTPPYMSPELIGEDSELDARSDIYALGSMLVELCTGKIAIPEQGARTETQYLVDIFEHVIDGSAIADPGVRRIVERCTIKSRKKRFQGHLELMDAIEHYLGQ